MVFITADISCSYITHDEDQGDVGCGSHNF